MTREEVIVTLAKSPVRYHPNFEEVLEEALRSENYNNFPSVARIIDWICTRLYAPDENENKRKMYEGLMVGRIDLSGAVITKASKVR